MTKPAPRLLVFVTAIVVLFAVALVIGHLIDPSPPKAGSSAEVRKELMSGEMQRGAHGTGVSHAGDVGDDATAMTVRGLGAEENGRRIVLDRTSFPRGEERQLRFRVVDNQGTVVRDYDVVHTKRMHLFVVRRDLAYFQHLHPTMRPDGTWVAPIRLNDAGTFRVLADFSEDDQPTTLATDITADGHFVAAPLPDPSNTALADQFKVQVDSDQRPVAGVNSELNFSVTRKNGDAVSVEPYLGADGHLVVLRQGDLAFLHVHPIVGSTFEATFPGRGKYRLYYQFKVDGQVHTAEFTRVVK